MLPQLLSSCVHILPVRWRPGCFHTILMQSHETKPPISYPQINWCQFSVKKKKKKLSGFILDSRGTCGLLEMEESRQTETVSVSG